MKKRRLMDSDGQRRQRVEEALNEFTLLFTVDPRIRDQTIEELERLAEKNHVTVEDLFQGALLYLRRAGKEPWPQ
jgi:rRNA-processing protein FCF1